MISNPMYGWCTFQLGEFKGHASYLTDVPIDLINAFIEYRKTGKAVVNFDEEGSFFTLILSQYNNNIFIIEDRDEIPILHDFSDFSIQDLENELIQDIESDIEGWARFIFGRDDEDFKESRQLLIDKLNELKNIK